MISQAIFKVTRVMQALDLLVNRWYPTTDGPTYADQVPTIQKGSAASTAYVAPSIEGTVAIPATGYDDPPNGGLVAWLQVAGSFFLFFNSWYELFECSDH